VTVVRHAASQPCINFGGIARTRVLGLLGAILMLSCSACAVLDRGVLDSAIAAAANGGLLREDITLGRFQIASWHRGLRGATHITVYLEGDGHAWISRRRLSDDPTPRDPIALRLASKDPARAVLYLARPCQFGDRPSAPICDARYWSSHRYAPEVLAAFVAALDWAASQAGPNVKVRFGLVGYSGGGALAALLAQQRDDIAWLVTIAANLDVHAWTRHHRLSRLSGSLDPVVHAQSLRGLPQQHLIGDRDDVVPALTRARFLAASGASQRIVEGVNHSCCWAESWPALLCRFLAEIPATTGTTQSSVRRGC
jgi:hypothetical protein